MTTSHGHIRADLECLPHDVSDHDGLAAKLDRAAHGLTTVIARA